MTSGTKPGLRSIRIDGLRRRVSDLRRSIDFYCGALGFEESRADAPSTTDAIRLRLGEQHIDLVLRPDPAHAPVPVNAPGPRFQHAAIVTRDIEATWRQLERHSAVAITRGGPQRLPAHTGGVIAFKFRDPDGHPLELIEFPAGVGDACWQVDRPGGPTLGIDHFALVVGGVDRSVAFFADRLGLRVAGRGINSGVEQDRLDGIDGVKVDVASLEPKLGRRTPHLELLGYCQPAFSGPIDVTGVASPGGSDEIVCRRGRSLSAADAIVLHDPDGHRFILEH